eukprot:Gregarina_sp_Poly_1__1176@NODE_128_length_13277_cov_115_450643_g114_i0_p2_GENE_NODE_128_length_13277_cov_115_450643_g114_i0NODE_128_length_13277_cov_115_450643_g114_i0_p2_ORF_typecomplete_len573_score72_95NTF2/PF02136_20/0_015G_path_suppress/PF15991_5/1_6_NODE_128_length_13277_cov_115_450643_g114_i0885810576
MSRHQLAPCRTTSGSKKQQFFAWCRFWQGATMHCYAGDTRQTSMSSFAAGCEVGENAAQPPPSGNARQSRVIEVAESLLQDYYTRLSTDPLSLSSLYLENAEVIYTGRELNVDAVYACGRAEIEDFLRSDAANKFRCARVVVDALHPQASPTSFFGISLFAKGRLFLSKPTTGVSNIPNFVQTPYVHFVSLAPPAKPGTWGEMPPLYIANEYFHLLNISLSTPSGRLPVVEVPPALMMRSTDPPTAPVSAHTGCVTHTDIPVSAPSLPSPRSDPAVAKETESATRHAPLAKDHSQSSIAASQPRPSSSSNHRWSQDGGDGVSSRHNMRSSNSYQHQSLQQHEPSQQRSTVHAQPGFSFDMPDDQIVSALSECIRQIGGGSCHSISKPRAVSGGSEYPYFFIHCDSQESAQLLLNIKNIHVLGQDVRLSPQRPSAHRAHYTLWNRGGGSSFRSSALPRGTLSRRSGEDRGVSSSARTGSDVPAGDGETHTSAGAPHRSSLQRGGRGSSSRGGWMRRSGFHNGPGRGGSSLRGGAVSVSGSRGGASPLRKSVLVKSDGSRVSTSGDLVTSPREV